MPKQWSPLAAITFSFLCAVAGSTHAADTARVIVKFKPDSTMLRPQVLSAQQAQTQAKALGTRVGMALSGHTAIDTHTQVVTAQGMGASALAARLAQEADVEFAVPDQKRYAHASPPNDPRFGPGLGGNGPKVGQWYLRAPSDQTPAAINAQAAWDLTLGSPNVVVAVLDTGVRYDHAELLPVDKGGNVLPGYDMVTDLDAANDGNGRDSDATDPGDNLSAQDVRPGGPFANCSKGAEPSTWHGTQTAGLIGALTNNGEGMASVGRNVRILPVRVLGKCGGYDSDILAGMRWAAGLHVPGVPDNPNPAKVLNLSLGAPGSCDKSYVDAIREINAAGASVVISAGNSAGEAVSSPANCAGALAVGGLQHTGAKVGFSDLGPEVAISAPAGNCFDSTGECKFPILTTTNAGSTLPMVGSSSYTDSYNYSVGTSFSSPLVAGAIGLMLSVKPDLTPAQIKQLLQSSARPFPTSGAVSDQDASLITQCTAPQFDDTGAPIPQLQCYCTSATCGAGMLDVRAAVQAATGTKTTPREVKSSDSGGGAAGGAWLLGLFSGIVVLAGLQRRQHLRA
jgi:serine protease